MIATDSLCILNDQRHTDLALIDTHTHFDAPVFDRDRLEQAHRAMTQGVHHLVLVGYLYRHFERMYATEQSLNSYRYSIEGSNNRNENIRNQPLLNTHIALGLHPFYIEQHTDDDLWKMGQLLNERRPLAIGEIGLDTYTEVMKQPANFAKQQRFFHAQLDMAVRHELPVMLHIRKAHAEALALLKAHDYDAHKRGGIAHSFSGGEQEAKAFVKLGFKLGVTGQVTNPNAKKLRRAIQVAVDSYGIECLVIETDCPDMTPIMCQQDNVALNQQSDYASALGQGPDNEWGEMPAHNRNVPANLPWVLRSLSELLDVEPAHLAKQLWQNSCDALQTTWTYPE